MRISHIVWLASLQLLAACSSSSSKSDDNLAAGARAGSPSDVGGAKSTAFGNGAGSAGIAATSLTLVGGSVTSAAGSISSGGDVTTAPLATGGVVNNATGSTSSRGGTTGVFSAGGTSNVSTGSFAGRSGTPGTSIASGGKPNTAAGSSSNGGSATGASSGRSGVGGKTSTGGVTSVTHAAAGSTFGLVSTAGAPASGGAAAGASGSVPPGSEEILYGTPYTNVNMWYGPVDFSESVYHNGCGFSDGSKYSTTIQKLYGNYLIGLDGEHIANVESHCDDCAKLTANGKTIVAHIITYGIENGVNAIDLSPEAQTALGLSSSNWTGTWQFVSCPTNGTPIYYDFDARQWDPQNFWYMRLWTRNHRLPVTQVETKIGTASWVKATRQSDGAWQTTSGVDFSSGFQVRVTGADNQQLVDTIPAPTGLNPAISVAGKTNFQ